MTIFCIKIDLHWHFEVIYVPTIVTIVIIYKQIQNQSVIWLSIVDLYENGSQLLKEEQLLAVPYKYLLGYSYMYIENLCLRCKYTATVVYYSHTHAYTHNISNVEFKNSIIC